MILELPSKAGSGLAMAAPCPAIRNPLLLSSAAGTVYESGSGARAPAVSLGNIVLLPLREEHLRDRAHDPVADDPVLHDPEPALSDRSSMVARFRQRTSELECKFEVGVSISVPDNSPSYATVSSASPLPAGVDVLPGLAALP